MGVCTCREGGVQVVGCVHVVKGVYKSWGCEQVMGVCTSRGGVYKCWGCVQVMGV